MSKILTTTTRKKTALAALIGDRVLKPKIYWEHLKGHTQNLYGDCQAADLMNSGSKKFRRKEGEMRMLSSGSIGLLDAICQE